MEKVKNRTLVVYFLLALKREIKKCLTLTAYFLHLETPGLPACYPLTNQHQHSSSIYSFSPKWSPCVLWVSPLYKASSGWGSLWVGGYRLDVAIKIPLPWTGIGSAPMGGESEDIMMRITRRRMWEKLFQEAQCEQNMGYRLQDAQTWRLGLGRGAGGGGGWWN